MKLLTSDQWQWVKDTINCDKCVERNGCDQLDYSCPLANYETRTFDGKIVK